LQFYFCSPEGLKLNLRLDKSRRNTMKSKKIESMIEVLLVIAIFMILAWFIEVKISSPFWGLFLRL